MTDIVGEASDDTYGIMLNQNCTERIHRNLFA